MSLYTSLLALQWFSPERSIPSHPELVRGLVRWDSATFDRYWPIVSEKFVGVDVNGKSRLQNRRCEWHRDKVLDYSERQAEAGRRGGLTRARNAKARLGEEQGSLELGTSNPNENSSSHPIPSHPIPIHPSVSDSPNGESSSATADRVPVCPHETIIELYHELLPNNPRVESWTPARRAKLGQRWKGKTGNREHWHLEFWRAYFTYVAASPFLTGKVPPREKDRRPFVANLEWLVTESHFVNILERKYHHD